MVSLISGSSSSSSNEPNSAINKGWICGLIFAARA
jgi:hypothetical protein